MHNLYVDSIKEIEKAGKSDIERIIKRIRDLREGGTDYGSI